MEYSTAVLARSLRGIDGPRIRHAPSAGRGILPGTTFIACRVGRRIQVSARPAMRPLTSAAADLVAEPCCGEPPPAARVPACEQGRLRDKRHERQRPPEPRDHQRGQDHWVVIGDELHGAEGEREECEERRPEECGGDPGTARTTSRMQDTPLRQSDDSRRASRTRRCRSRRRSIHQAGS
jgi:hypothetical protein